MTADVKKTSSAQRAQISALKRQVEELGRELNQSLCNGGAVAAAAADPKDQDAGDLRRRFRISPCLRDHLPRQASQWKAGRAMGPCQRKRWRMRVAR